jgi:hypothetical protein
VQGFKLLIILWRALRLSIGELQSQQEPPLDLLKYPKIHNPAQTVVHSVISALAIYDSEAQHISHELVNTVDGLDNLDYLESEFIDWMRQVCKRRNVWDIGYSMGKVLDELCAIDSEAVSKR